MQLTCRRKTWMQATINTREFLAVTLPAIRMGDVGALAQSVRVRWSSRDLCGLLHQADADVRRVAAVTLGLVGDATAIQCLARALRDPDEQVNAMAEHALWSLWFRAGAPAAMPSFRQGLSFMAAEDHLQATVCLQRALLIDPDFAEAHHQCAISHSFLGCWDQALECCRQAVRRMPVHFGGVAFMGHCYTHMDRLDKAILCYRRALAINPRMTAIRRMTQRLDQRLRQRNDASGEFLVAQFAD